MARPGSTLNVQVLNLPLHNLKREHRPEDSPPHPQLRHHDGDDS